MKNLFIVLSLFVLLSPSVHSKEKSEAELKLTDHWFTMKIGKTPWGYFRESVTKKDGQFFYRYEMSKKENGKLYQESLGAISKDNMEPVAFNLNKQGQNISESYSGTYKDQGEVGQFSVELTGSRTKTMQRHVRKGVILEAFLTVWFHKNWDSLKPGFRQSISVFAEDADSGEYQVKSAQIEFAKERKDGNTPCKEMKVAFDTRKSIWCVDKNAGLVDMTMPDVNLVVKRARDEAEAKAFLK